MAIDVRRVVERVILHECHSGGAALLPEGLATHVPERSPLTEQEVAVVKKLQSAVRTIRRGSDIIVQGRKYDGIFIIIDGFSLR